MLDTGPPDFAWPECDYEPTDEDANDYRADCKAQEEHEENSGNDGPPADGPLY